MVMAVAIALFPFFFLLVAPVAVADEAEVLLLLKASLTNANALSSWSPGKGVPCSHTSSWDGVTCDAGVVASLRLAGLGLSGRIDVNALARLPGLRSISLDDNSFSGPIPPFSRLHALKSIYLSGNSFSGQIPDDFFSAASHLKKLWLSNNAFEGSIPSSLSKAVSLIELHLEGNHFTGGIPNLPMPKLASFDVSKNQLSGPIPSSLRKFNASAFSGNVGLCGPPLENICVGAAAAAGTSSGSSAAAVGLVFVVLLALGAAMAVAAKRRNNSGFKTLGVEKATPGIDMAERREREAQPPEVTTSAAVAESTRKGKRSSSSVQGGRGSGEAELVMVNEAKGIFVLSSLMKAAAEAMGNGGMGSAYKAVMANGLTVVVKRMNEMNRVGKETFEVEMRRLGRLNHPNVLPPLAYLYRKEKKLLISEYIPKGSLLYILHGDRGNDHAALNWPTRLKIIRGIAQGMAFLHSELNFIVIPHGNLKSANVLLGPDFDPLLVDYGFLPLVNPSHASQTMFAFKSPEILENRHLSPKSDVYCLGIIVLELLSGKVPSLYLNDTKGGTDLVRWTNSVIAENIPWSIIDPFITQGFKAEVLEMEQMVRVGAELIDSDMDRRPDMKEAARRIEEVVEKVEGRRKEDGGSSAGLNESLMREGQNAAGLTGDGVGVRRTANTPKRSRSIEDYL
ncbi:hypothetical protein M5K25_018580 [Dendrobium thyrsiflorum]|uniref:Protein kinase domain-containing protein n=1 Tax=Dendrobium thyrsiflorum TaxID=117978 RepID=A0ABD0UQW3_DENTH